MQEVKLKTHLIVTDIHEEYTVKWCGKLIDVKPLLKNGLPIFVLSGNQGRLELNTIDIQYIEQCAKKFCRAHGRAAITSDVVDIYILDEDENQKLMGHVFHNHVKQYQQMYDKFEYI